MLLCCKMWRQTALPTLRSDCSKHGREADDLILETRVRVGIAEEMLKKVRETEKFNKRSCHQVKSSTPCWRRCTGGPGHMSSSGRVTSILSCVLKNLARSGHPK